MLTDNNITQTVLTGHMDYYEKGEKGMGEHKRNPNVILTKEGKLPDRVKRKSKKEVEKEIQQIVAETMLRKMMGVE